MHQHRQARAHRTACDARKQADMTANTCPETELGVDQLPFAQEVMTGSP